MHSGRWVGFLRGGGGRRTGTVPIKERLYSFRSKIFNLLRAKWSDVCFDTPGSYGNENESHKVVNSAHTLKTWGILLVTCMTVLYHK